MSAEMDIDGAVAAILLPQSKLPTAASRCCGFGWVRREKNVFLSLRKLAGGRSTTLAP